MVYIRIGRHQNVAKVLYRNLHIFCSKQQNRQHCNAYLDMFAFKLLKYLQQMFGKYISATRIIKKIKDTEYEEHIC